MSARDRGELAWILAIFSLVGSCAWAGLHQAGAHHAGKSTTAANAPFVVDHRNRVRP